MQLQNYLVLVPSTHPECLMLQEYSFEFKVSGPIKNQSNQAQGGGEEEEEEEDEGGGELIWKKHLVRSFDALVTLFLAAATPHFDVPMTPTPHHAGSGPFLGLCERWNKKKMKSSKEKNHLWIKKITRSCYS